MQSILKEHIKQLSEGNEVIFKMVFNAFYPRMVGLAMKFLHDLPASEDIVSEIFRKLWENRETISEFGSFEAFLYTSVKNGVMNYLRNTTKHQEHHHVIFKELNGETYSETIIEEAVHHKLYAALNTLPQKGREIFELSVIHGWKDKEIAEDLGISINTVKTHKKRSLKSLRSKLDDNLYMYILLLAYLNC